MLGEFPLPNDPHTEERESDEQGGEDVGRVPRMSVATSLKGDEEESKTADGEETSHKVNTLENGIEVHSFRSNVCVWEVGEQQSEAGDTVIGEGDPWSDSPADAGGEKLAVEDIWAEGEHERGQDSERVASVLDGDGFSETSETREFADTSTSACEGLTDECLSEGVGSTHYGTADAQAESAKDGDVALAEKILQVADERAHGGDGQCVGHGDPANCLCVANIGRNVGERATSEVQQDLRACSKCVRSNQLREFSENEQTHQCTA